MYIYNHEHHVCAEICLAHVAGQALYVLPHHGVEFVLLLPKPLQRSQEHHTRMWVYVHMYMCIHMYVYVCQYMYICIHIYMCV